MVAWIRAVAMVKWMEMANLLHPWREKIQNPAFDGVEVREGIED